MTSFPEQFSAARKAGFEAQFDFFNSFASQALESAGRVVALNLATSRDSVQRSLGATFALMNSRDPRDLLTAGGQAEEQMRSLFDYSRELFSIASGVRPYAVLPHAPKATQQAIETVQVVERTSVDAVAEAAPQAAAAVAAPVAAPETPVMADTVITAEPIMAELAPAAKVVSDATVEALAAEALEPAPAGETKAIANLGGKGGPQAAVAAHPAAAPVAESAESPKIEVRAASSKRKK